LPNSSDICRICDLHHRRPNHCCVWWYLWRI